MVINNVAEIPSTEKHVDATRTNRTLTRGVLQRGRKRALGLGSNYLSEPHPLCRFNQSPTTSFTHISRINGEGAVEVGGVSHLKANPPACLANEFIFL